jgi:hypothetical protein
MSKTPRVMKLAGLPIHRAGTAAPSGGRASAFQSKEAEIVGDILARRRDVAPAKPKKALGRKPRALAGKGWDRSEETIFNSARDKCLASKPKCTTKYTGGRRVRKCYRDCEKVAAATMGRARKPAGRSTPVKKSRRRKTKKSR